jgi:hypothetical protein
MIALLSLSPGRLCGLPRDDLARLSVSGLTSAGVLNTPVRPSFIVTVIV